MSSSARAKGIVAGISLGLVVPLAAQIYADFVRPIADVPTSEPESYQRVAVASVVLAVLGWAIVTRTRRLRAAAAWMAAVVASAVFVLAARRGGDMEGHRVVRDMRIAGDLALDGAPLLVGALAIDLRRPEPGGDTCDVHIVAPGRRDTVIVIGSYLGCVRVRVRHDAQNDVAIVEHVPVWAAPWSDIWTRLTAVSTRDGSPIALDARTLRRSLGVRPELAAGAAFTAALALTFLLAARAQRRRQTKLADLVDAVHVGEGWFAMSDGRRLQSASAWARELPVGEFAVRLVEPPEAPTYRESAAAIVEPVTRGSATTQANEARALVMTYEGVAMFVAALGMTPALVALYVLRPGA